MMKPLLFSFALSLALSIKAEAESSFEPWSYTDKDLYPGAIVSTATVDWNGEQQVAEDKRSKSLKLAKDELALFGDENGWLAVELIDIPKGTEIEVEIGIDGFLKPSKWKGTAKKHYPDARIFPEAAWDFTALLANRQPRPVTATYKVTLNGKLLGQETETYIMHSINDCPFYVLWDEKGKEYDDFSWLFAAYVNENHPIVDEILGEALQTGLVDEFSGYQSGDPDLVYEQIFAIWQVLQRRGIKYSDVSTTTPGRYVVSQSVRFLDDSIESSQANCVDGSVLLASILQKIGINTYLAMVPGHCLLAFDDGDHNNAEVIGIETTKLGDADLTPVKGENQTPEGVSKKEFKASLRTFTHAIEEGEAQLEQYWKRFMRGRNPDIQLISILEARELGIMPIATD
ncbi:MAG: hypothetical protein VXX36_00660 [Verrucomicrobiota bacterium]|nr:hypothetical protein [Verrucomicrobiota bacterium]